MMKDNDFKPLKDFALGRTNEQTDICNCRVTFATEKSAKSCMILCKIHLIVVDFPNIVDINST